MIPRQEYFSRFLKPVKMVQNMSFSKQNQLIYYSIWGWSKCDVKFLLLPLKCESQTGPENQMIREMSSHCDKNSAHNVRGKYRWIPLICQISGPIGQNSILFHLCELYGNSAALHLNTTCIIRLGAYYWHFAVSIPSSTTDLVVEFSTQYSHWEMEAWSFQH